VDPRPVNLHEYAPLAQRRLSEQVWNYVAGGAGDEHSLRWNEQAWQRLALWPRVLVDVSRVDTTTTLVGHRLAHPILLAPTAAQASYHPGAEAATLAGAADAESLAVMSTLGSTPVAELGAAAAGPWWFQLYVQPDRPFTEGLVGRAVEAGASALVVTVDTPLLGARDTDRRLGGHTVDAMQPPNLAAPASPSAPRGTRAHQQVHNPHLDPSLTWAELSWLVELSPVPVLAKGVVRPADARRAVDCGVSGVVVSNHGARNLDTVVATAAALPRVVASVGGQLPVLVDGGIRRGTDVAKALCLGADAVLIGRPAIWGLAVDGPTGVRDVVDLLRAELMMAMGLLGAPSLDALTADLVSPAD
jgi:4-hydroxymandelate oxidase